MDASTAEVHAAERAPAQRGRNPRFIAYAVAAVAGVAATAVLAFVLLGSGSAANDGTAGAGATRQTAFAFFDEFHATLILTPATTGANTVDVVLANHDGTVPDVSEVSVSAALPSAGVEAPPSEATPVEGSPGTYRAELSLPEAGDWELTLSVGGGATEPSAETTIVPIGAR